MRAPESRLFLALWPDAATVAQIEREVARWVWPERAARVAAGRWHLTLHFIGLVPNARLAELKAGLAVPVSPFVLDFGMAEIWPRGLAVTSPIALPAALLELHAALGAALVRLRLPVEARPFRPHLTLARKAARAGPPEQPLALHWPVDSYALVQSVGAYRTLACYR